ncbi:MAG: glycosyltransferase family 4 protein [Acidimicrobiia bacterium]
MRIVFVSSVAAGGSGTSQRQLARRLADRGHDVELLAATPSSRMVRQLYDRQVDLTSGRLRSSRVRPALLALQRLWGTRIRRSATPDFPTGLAVVPENAYRRLAAAGRPDVVVASSIERVSWRRLRGQLRAAGIPSVLYLREQSAIGHLTITGGPPDLLLANAVSLAAAAEAAGYACTVVPSVVEVERARTESSRRAVVLVNPIPLLGGDRLFPIAAARPDIPFVVQESGLLSSDERAEVQRRAAGLPNVEIRPFSSDPAAVFRDARVLLVPHRVDNRPRVVLEAQTNGIPVIASGYPGLVESVGAGGIVVADTDDPGPWIEAVAELWDDPVRYAALVDAAREHAARPEVDPEQVVDRFEELVTGLVRPARS